jgi:hypothetical protein
MKDKTIPVEPRWMYKKMMPGWSPIGWMYRKAPTGWMYKDQHVGR